FDDARSVVGGAVVDDDRFEGTMILRDDRIEGAGEEIGAVVGGDDGTDGGFHVVTLTLTLSRCTGRGDKGASAEADPTPCRVLTASWIQVERRPTWCSREKRFSARCRAAFAIVR